jgi:parallel beta-helix repeat protein
VTLRSSDITLTSYPGERATVVGRLWVANTANQATVTGLNLDGANSQNLPSPTVNANNVTFSNDNVTDDHTAICFDIGSDTWGTATGTVITQNRIHDCGVLPAINHDHGIYLEAAYNTQITWNLIYDNADRGIQFYPSAQNTVVAHNIIDGNGEDIIFSGDFGVASSNNQVYDNLLTNAVIRHDVESWYPSGNPIGVNNVVTNNCIWGGAESSIDMSGGGFTASGNTIANPEYVDAAVGNYELQPRSPCLSISGDVAAVVNGTESVAQATSSSPPSAAGGSSGSLSPGVPVSEPTSSTPTSHVTAPVKAAATKSSRRPPVRAHTNLVIAARHRKSIKTKAKSKVKAHKRHARGKHATRRKPHAVRKAKRA